MFGVLVRFYLPVMKFADLHEMKEDLIELMTSLVLQNDMGKYVFNLCRIATRNEEQLLLSKFKDYKNLIPEEVGISDYFTLDRTS